MRVVDGLHSHEGRTKVVWIDGKVCQELLATMDEDTVRAIYEDLKERFAPEPEESEMVIEVVEPEEDESSDDS